MEAELEDFKVDPSLGSHFFHNVTSMNIGFLDIPWGSDTCFVDWNWLFERRAVHTGDHFVHLRFDDPLVVKMDGRKRVAVVFKP